MSETDTAYIGVKPCGCIVAATVARPEHAESWGHDIAAWAKRGLRIEQTTVGEARAMPKFLANCTCEREPQKEGLFS